MHEELRDALPLVELVVRLTAPLTEQAGLGSRAVAQWTGEGVLRVSGVGVDAPWSQEDVALDRREADAGVLELVVASCTGLTVDLHWPAEAVDVLESFVAYAHFLPLLDPKRSSGLHEEVDSRVAGRGPRLVLLDRVSLAPAWRGMGGVGRLLVSRLVRWLATDTRLVALQPFPTQFANAGDAPGFAEAREKVQGVWATIGFTPWRDDIWCLDPASPDFTRAVTRLENRLGVSEV